MSDFLIRRSCALLTRRALVHPSIRQIHQSMVPARRWRSSHRKGPRHGTVQQPPKSVLVPSDEDADGEPGQVLVIRF